MQQMLERSVDRMKTFKGIMLDDQHTVTGNAAQRSGPHIVSRGHIVEHWLT